MLLSSRVVTAEEAQAIGLVHRVLPPEELLDAAVAYGADLVARCGPGALAATKRQLYVDWSRQLGEAMDDALELADAATRGEEFRQGVAARLEGRRHTFRT